MRRGARGGYDIHGRLDVHRNVRGRREVPPARIGAVWYVPGLLVRSREHMPVSTGLHRAAGSLGAWRPSSRLCLPLLRVATLRDPGPGGHNPAGWGPALGSFLTQFCFLYLLLPSQLVKVPDGTDCKAASLTPQTGFPRNGVTLPAVRMHLLVEELSKKSASNKR